MINGKQLLHIILRHNSKNTIGNITFQKFEEKFKKKAYGEVILVKLQSVNLFHGTFLFLKMFGLAFLQNISKNVSKIHFTLHQGFILL